MTVTAEPPTAARGRSRIFSLAKFVVSAFLLAFIISKAGGHALAHTLLHARPGWLAVGLVLTAGAVGASAAQWQVLLAASDMPRRFRRLLSLEIACKAFDAALPSSIGGDVARTLLVADTPQERLRATRITLLRRVTGVPGAVVLIALGLAFCWRQPYAGRILPYAVICLLGGTAGLVVVASPLMGTLSRWGLLQRTGASRVVARLLESLHQFRSEQRALAMASLLELGFWLFVVASAWAYMRAVGIHPPIAYAAVVVLVVNALSMLPISLGGYGLREGTFSLFLAVGGIATAAQGAAVGLCITVQTLLMGLLGIPIYLLLGRQRHALREKQLIAEPT